MSKSLEAMTFDSGYTCGFKAGWEQAKKEAYSLSQQHSLLSSTKSGEIEINELAIAIAAMEYKEPTNV